MNNLNLAGDLRWKKPKFPDNWSWFVFQFEGRNQRQTHEADINTYSKRLETVSQEQELGADETFYNIQVDIVTHSKQEVCSNCSRRLNDRRQRTSMRPW